MATEFHTGITIKRNQEAQFGQGSTGDPSITFENDNDTGLWTPTSNRLVVVTGGTDRWEWDASGHYWPKADNTYDLGKTGNEVRDLYIDGALKGAESVDTPTSFGSASDWTATTTNPTNRGWSAVYVRRGKKVSAFIALTANASFTVGSGQYIIGLFGTVDATNIPPNMSIGTWQASISGTLTGGNVRRQGTNLCRCTVNAGGTFGSANAMAVGDTLMLQVEYLVT